MLELFKNLIELYEADKGLKNTAKTRGHHVSKKTPQTPTFPNQVPKHIKY
jgi:hypothetical protein